jgi:hypothetical protein
MANTWIFSYYHKRLVYKHTNKARGVGFEPTSPFEHGISNPTPYQARRPPLSRMSYSRIKIHRNINHGILTDGGTVCNPMFKKVIKRKYMLILSLNLKESNEIFRRAIIKAYFEPELQKMDYRKSIAKHPLITDYGLTSGQDVLHLFFDIITGNDYPDGDEWFTIEYLLPYSVKLPDKLKGPDYFSTIMASEEKHFWRHRELIRFKYGKSKKLSESLEFMNQKYLELVKALHNSSVIEDLK